jgi:asparagine synthase (glutamine-hydrolysing)
MCGIVGYFGRSGQTQVGPSILRRMMAAVEHRGPDAAGCFTHGAVGLGFRRLSIIDLAGGDQPIFNEDKTIALICNGEIYNYKELRSDLIEKGHKFSTNSDVEVIVHLYEEFGTGLLRLVNGQFAFALYDFTEQSLLLARDNFGIAPLYYTVQDGVVVFSSEIKAILEFPGVARVTDLIGLDQVVCFPGLVSPRTMFRGISALPPGCMISTRGSDIKVQTYWDLDYPRAATAPSQDDSQYEETLLALFRTAVERRLQSDVPVGFFVSGGLDSSMILCMARQLRPHEELNTFSITFEDKGIDEGKYQKLVSNFVSSKHHEIRFSWTDIIGYFERMIFHTECPVKETFNTCAMALSSLVRQSDIKVILGGEGADELFAGYPGYRFDAFAAESGRAASKPSNDELQLRQTLWGDASVGYERGYVGYAAHRLQLYSADVRARLRESNALASPLVDRSKLIGRHPLHQRSYLDLKLRLADHLLTDHGDRMLMANSVEGRYPFLDPEFVEFARELPPGLKLRGLDEKYILKRLAARFVPKQIVQREKYGFHAPGSPWLLRQNAEWVNDLLSPERIRRDGYFDPAFVEHLKRRSSDPKFHLDARADDDLLVIVLSFNLFCDIFRMSGPG